MLSPFVTNGKFSTAIILTAFTVAYLSFPKHEWLTLR
jgi:hypothetical protein